MDRMLLPVILLCLLLAACGTPDTTLRATTLPNPTNVPATPGPSPTPAMVAYPYPAPERLAAPLAGRPQYLAVLRR
jgi:uncharacterized lipoprotein YmbA